MPRSVRIEYAGAVYHVMCRGDRREAIFQDDEDRRMMLETLEEVCGRTGFVIHSYVLMPNHYHLLIETPKPNLVAGMKWFQGTYTQRYNRRHGFSGHLFQGRYKAVPVEADEPAYFRIVSDYIHLNPARARLLEGEAPSLRAFAWSSFPAFAGASDLPAWLCRARVFASHELPEEGRGSRRRYGALLGARAREAVTGATDETLSALRRGWYVGSDRFRDRLMDRVDAAVRGRKRASYRAEGLAGHDERAAATILRQALAALEVSLPELRRRRQTDPAKQAVAWWVKSRTVVGDEWICERLRMGSRTNVSRAVGRFRRDGDRVTAELKRKLHACAD